jgi:hypothetical protein
VVVVAMTGIVGSKAAVRLAPIMKLLITISVSVVF